MTAKTKGARTPLGWLFTVAGYGVLIAVVAAAALMAAPQAFGWKALTVLTGSMAPALPVGSVVYAAPADPAQLEEGDIVVFTRGGETVTHRVESNHTVEGELITKGDANAEPDLAPVPYSAVQGKVVIDAPWLGDILSALATGVGKVYLLAAGACGVMLTVLGNRCRKAPEAEEE